MSHVFVSYSTRNSEYAYKLADKLWTQGFDVWIDNAELRSSDNWWESIVLALRSCNAVIVIMTPEAKQSKWVQREVTLADNWNKPTFPVLLAGENWEMFVLTQYEDVRQDGGNPPNYPGKTPSRAFYEKLTQYVPRQKTPGADVTGQPEPGMVTIDSSVAAEIANPPPEDDNTLPLSTQKTFLQKLNKILSLPVIQIILAPLIIGIILVLLQVVLQSPNSPSPTLQASLPSITPTETSDTTVNTLLETPEPTQNPVSSDLTVPPSATLTATDVPPTETPMPTYTLTPVPSEPPTATLTPSNTPTDTPTATPTDDIEIQITTNVTSEQNTATSIFTDKVDSSGLVLITPQEGATYSGENLNIEWTFRQLNDGERIMIHIRAIQHSDGTGVCSPFFVNGNDNKELINIYSLNWLFYHCTSTQVMGYLPRTTARWNFREDNQFNIKLYAIDARGSTIRTSQLITFIWNYAD